MSPERMRVLLADDHGLVAAGVRELLESRFEVVGVVSDGRSLIEMAAAERPDVILTFEAGAGGYLVKSSAPLELFNAIDEVLAGRRYVTSAVAGKMMDSLMSPESEPEPTESPLTRRETEIAGLVAQGLENAEIAERLCIAEVTVRTHFHRILHKLELRNRVELTRYALEQGWVALEPDPDPHPA